MENLNISPEDAAYVYDCWAAFVYGAYAVLNNAEGKI